MVWQMTSAWDARLVRGLAMAGIGAEASDALVTTLGALGCEAEYGLGLLGISAALPQPTHTQGDGWLRGCYSLCARLVRLSADFEVAVQTYLHALGALGSAAASPPTHRPRDSWTARFDDTPNVWWPERGDIAPPGEPLEFWLRRAGYAYRHIVTLGLPAHFETLAEALGTLLHALNTLPPGGVLARASLALGIETLAATFAGDLIPHHIVDMDARHPGLLTGLTTIAQLAPAENALAADITWARGELASAQQPLRGGQNGNGRVTRPLPSTTGSLWARQIITEWETTVAQLEALHVPAHASSI